MSQIYAHKRSNDNDNIEEIEDADIILNKLKLSSLNDDESSNRNEEVNIRMSKHLMVISKLENGVLISTIQNETYTLYIYLGRTFMKLFKMIINLISKI